MPNYKGLCPTCGPLTQVKDHLYCPYCTEQVLVVGRGSIQALSTTYGIDIDATNVEECHERIRKTFISGDDVSLLAIVLNNIKLGDCLLADPDSIVPYEDLKQRQRDALVDKALKWVKSGYSHALVMRTRKQETILDLFGGEEEGELCF